ncbi:MmcQ/YjbR family DNA-binding protein [Streptacidiphilus jiangxiensis]|uniref:Predicted DNA-binding protein, MmcQ/YjbR family n=1 Tax=Streptacidiphilus jiangxiensis TaxID=235985 RepID=A0A1H7UV29_STRJI|nr:MmcQ/YjbR family DNA-binding protein [Streptacidiphilus jiangxiensis]SEM00696.1 Predicted DNA-binding protein, MmcQ/YjbR family [Streptacidiphilus jiangxiensis]
MERSELLAYCLGKPGAWQDEPWEGDVVAKLGDKVFAFLGSPGGTSVGLKCGPDRDTADEWLRRYPGAVTASAYVGRYGWNTLALDGAVPDDELLAAVDDSYDAILAKLPRRLRPVTPP